MVGGRSVGQRAHLSKQFISDVERGAKGLSIESFLRYVRGLGISPLVVFDVDVHPFAGLVRAYTELPPWKQRIFLHIVVPALIELLKASATRLPYISNMATPDHTERWQTLCTGRPGMHFA